MLIDEIAPLITREQFCKDVDRELELTPSDEVTVYHTAFEIRDQMERDNLELLFVRPARISIAREIARRCKKAEIGEPYAVVNGNQVVVTVPVKENP